MQDLCLCALGTNLLCTKNVRRNEDIMKKRKVLKKIIGTATALAIVFSSTFSSFVPETTKSVSAKQTTEINDYGVLTDCKTNGTLYISKKVCAISAIALDKANITKFVVNNDNPSFKAIDGVLYTKNGTRLVRFPNNYSKSYTIPTGVKTISQYAFRNSEQLEEVIIPDTVTKIGEGAFYGCSSLSKISIPQKIRAIRPYTFFNCSSLKNIKLPSKLQILGSCSFQDCKSLKTINIPKNIESITYGTFMGCEKLKKISFPASLYTIGSQAFKDCKSLKSLKLPKKLAYIKKGAFYSCSSLKSVSLPDNIPTVNYNTFADCTSLKSFTFGKYTNEITSHAFYGCTSLKNITIPKNIESISSSAFENSVENFKVSSENAVYSSKNGVLYNKAQTSIKKYPCLKSGSYTFPDTVKNITYRAFANCKYLKTLTLTDKIKVLDLSSFSGSGITCLNLSAKLEFIYGSSSNFKNLKKITIPKSNPRFFVNDDVLYCYYDVDKYMSSNSASSWDENQSTSNYNILIYPTGKKGTVTILEQTLYTSDIPRENQASYFKTASIATGAAFCTSENGILTNMSKTEISVMPGRISNCYIGSKIKHLYYIQTYKTYLTNLKKYTVSDSNKYYKAKNGVLYNKAVTKLIDYPSQKTGSYKFPSTVTSVYYTAFKNAAKLEELKIGKNITSCRNLSLENCKNLTKFTIPEDCSVRRISLQLNSSVAPKLISIPTSLISFKMYGVSDKLRNKATIQGFTNTCAEKAAKKHKLNFISKGVVPTALKHIKIKEYINERYLKVSWAKSNDASGYEIYTDNNITKKIADSNITTTNIYIGKKSSTVLYIRAYNIVKGKKLYSKASKRYVFLDN